MRHWGSAFLLLLGACASYDAALPPTANVAADVAITDSDVDQVRGDIEWLADDAREGREAGTRGYDAAATYVAARFAEAGLNPGADGEWLQPVPLRFAAADMDASNVKLNFRDGRVIPLDTEEYYLSPSLLENSYEVSAPAVFVRYGISAPAFGIDDYEGLDVAGKIVVQMAGAPDELEGDVGVYFRSNSVKAAAASAHGAVGMIIVDPDLGKTRWSVRRARAGRSRATWVAPDGRADVAGPGLKVIARLSAAAGARLLAESQARFNVAASKEDKSDFKMPAVGFDLGVRIAMKGASTLEERASSNVVGIIEGVDPHLKNEVVILSAHLDHVGIAEPKEKGGDAINNGAMDNAIGVATMLNTAARFMRGEAPRRTIVFLAVTAEEKGLLGADYFAHHPTLGDRRIVANINLDMPLAFHEFTDVIAFGGERSSLHETVVRAASRMDVEVSPDPIPEMRIFMRSDHFRFVEQGVPAVFLFTGFANGGEEAFTDFMANHYHQPSDDISRPIRYDQAARFAKLNYLIARETSDAEEAPTWNDGDFFGDLFTQP